MRRSGLGAALNLWTMGATIPGATAVVLSKRLPILASEATKTRDRRECRRMVMEKVAAAAQASTAAGRAILDNASTCAGASRCAASAVHGGRAASLWAAAGLEAAFGMARIGEAMLKPAHRKVIANAKRLSRRRG